MCQGIDDCVAKDVLWDLWDVNTASALHDERRPQIAGQRIDQSSLR